MSSRYDAPPTHRDLCSATLGWFLALPWCNLGAFELGLEGGYNHALNHRGSGQADVLAISSPQLELVNARRLEAHERGERQRCAAAERHGAVFYPSKPPDLPRPRIAIAEVKRTRSDLLADLRAGKLLRYAEVATHLYLAATDEALGLAGDERLTRERTAKVLADLAEHGLPRTWGVLRLRTWRQAANRDDERTGRLPWHVAVDPLRTPARQLEDAPAAARAYWTDRIARSLLYRTMGGSLPDHLQETAA